MKRKPHDRACVMASGCGDVGHGEHPPVLIVAASRDDRRLLFDALAESSPDEILSARDAEHARALLRRGASPALAILDFEHMPAEARALCLELAKVPVIGLLGVNLDTNDELAACSNVKAWLRVPVDPATATDRIRQVLAGETPALEPPVPVAVETTAVLSSPEEEDGSVASALRAVASLMQVGRGAADWQGFAQRVLDVLEMDFLVIAQRVGSGTELAPLVRIDQRPAPGAAIDFLHLPVMQRALGGETVVGTKDDTMAATDDVITRVPGCARYAVAPLQNAHRHVVGVLVCASRSRASMPETLLRAWLEIVAARCDAILELRAEHMRGRTRALLDGLTGLPNRMLFNDRLESTVHDARRTGETFAVLFVDLDRFKTINDSLGHAVGDKVLVAEARRLRASVRASDTVARYAGDEFTVILRHVRDRADVDRVVEKLWLSMQAPLVLGEGSEMRVTASIGVSVYPDDASDAESLVKRADTAMYNSKGRGRNTVQTFANTPEESHRQRLEMESHLRAAEDQNELRIFYQPQVDVASEDIAGVEALLRWQHPTLGLLSRDFFVPLAEESGLILSLGEWLLRRACSDVSAWQRSTGLALRLAVSLSALQWMQPNLVAVVEAACRDAGLEPERLDLETTESVLANPQPELAATLAALRRLGCQIMLNDAGAGHTVEGQAASLPVDGIRIDRGFVANIGRDPADEALVSAMLDMAQRLQHRVVAEGVETVRQLGFLRERGCAMAQGILFCRPLAASDLAGLLDARQARMLGGGSNPVDVATGSQTPQNGLA